MYKMHQSKAGKKKKSLPFSESCFSLSYVGWKPLNEMYIPLPAVIRHDSISK